MPSLEDLPTQGLNPDLQHCRQILYQLSHQGSPVTRSRITKVIAANICWLLTTCQDLFKAYAVYFFINTFNNLVILVLILKIFYRWQILGMEHGHSKCKGVYQGDLTSEIIQKFSLIKYLMVIWSGFVRVHACVYGDLLLIYPMAPASLCAPIVYTENLCLWAKFLYTVDLLKFFALRLFKLLEYEILFLHLQHTEKYLSNGRVSINICWMNEWMNEYDPNYP